MTVVAQRKDWDCGVAALAMLLGKSYGDISAAVRDLFPDVKKIHRNGLNIAEMELVADHFGVTLHRRYRSHGYLDGATGILGLLGTKLHRAGHWIVLKDGNTVVEPDGGEVWTLTDYLHHWDARTCTMLVESSPLLDVAR